MNDPPRGPKPTTSFAWADGGPTDINQGCLLCSFHHHLVHHGQWAVVMALDGTPEILPRHASTPTAHPSATNASNPAANRRRVMRWRSGVTDE